MKLFLLLLLAIVFLILIGIYKLIYTNHINKSIKNNKKKVMLDYRIFSTILLVTFISVTLVIFGYSLNQNSTKNYHEVLSKEEISPMPIPNLTMDYRYSSSGVVYNSKMTPSEIYEFFVNVPEVSIISFQDEYNEFEVLFDNITFSIKCSKLEGKTRVDIRAIEDIKD